jgi:hypothetical protein
VASRRRKTKTKTKAAPRKPVSQAQARLFGIVARKGAGSARKVRRGELSRPEAKGVPFEGSRSPPCRHASAAAQRLEAEACASAHHASAHAGSACRCSQAQRSPCRRLLSSE